MAYDSILDSNDDVVRNGYDEVVAEAVTDMLAVVGDTPLSEMSYNQLNTVYKTIKMVTARINNANKAHTFERKETIQGLAWRVMKEIDFQRRESKFTTKAKETADGFLVQNLKPVYFFDRLGSETLNNIYEQVRAGEDQWANDESEAQIFAVEQYQKYNVENWDMDETFELESTSGEKFYIKLSELLSLYAYSRREQAVPHITGGGIVFENSSEIKITDDKGKKHKRIRKDATAYTLTTGTIQEAIDKLTLEQKNFVEEMQDFLTKFGEKGNTVSRVMYGIDLFNEDGGYFPIISASDYHERAADTEMRQHKGEIKIANKGMTKATVKNADNPIMILDFFDTWTRHINDMSLYHSFVLPLDDLNRIINYGERADGNTAESSVKATIKASFGASSVKYINKLIEDINGGVRRADELSLAQKYFSRFKKVKTMASLSVFVQQFSAIGRAVAYVDPKYFAPMSRTSHKETWEELKRYAPVAIIKEMGGFDTDVGVNMTRWMFGTSGSLMDKIDDYAGRLPALADELTWCKIWMACKRMAMDNLGERTETEEVKSPPANCSPKPLPGRRFTIQPFPAAKSCEAKA